MCNMKNVCKGEFNNMFFGFGSLSNKQDTDQPRYESRITKIKMEMYPVYSCHSINERSPTLVLEKTPS